jgi:glutathione reductase (NADPH)
MAVARRMLKPEQYRKVDYSTIPTAVFSLPNMATVGLTEEQAREQGYKVTLFESRFRPMKLTMTDSLERSLMKLVVDAHTDRVLGCHMAGPDAGEIMQGLAVALKAGATKQVFDETLGIHPTAAEEFVTKAYRLSRHAAQLSDDGRLRYSRMPAHRPRCSLRW